MSHHPMSSWLPWCFHSSDLVGCFYQAGHCDCPRYLLQCLARKRCCLFRSFSFVAASNTTQCGKHCRHESINNSKTETTAHQARFAWQAWYCRYLHRCPRKLGDEVGLMWRRGLLRGRRGTFGTSGSICVAGVLLSVPP